MKSLFVLLFSTILITSCATQRNYYVLSPAGPAPEIQGFGIGVGPVTLADYLVEKPYVAFQSSPNKLEISDLHEWAGDLSDDFGRVLGTNLGRRLGTGNIHTYPWMKESALRYQVVVDVRRLHGTVDGDALLEASWRVYRLPDSRLVISNTSTLTEPLDGDGYEELVAAQSRLVDTLAEVIAKSINR